MRREFYDHQYGGDEYCVRNKKKLPVSSSKESGGGGGTLSPTSPISETNILTNSTPKINNTNSTSNPTLEAQSQPQSRSQSRSQSKNNTPLKLQNQNVASNEISSNGGGQETGPNYPNPNRSPWTLRNNLNKTFETQLTTDQESEGVESESVVLSVI